MRAPVAARELALMAMTRLPADLQPALTQRITAGGNLSPQDLRDIRQVLETPSDVEGAALAHTLMGGAPMLRAIQAAAGDFSTGIMVALVPETPADFTVPDGLAEDELHVTLVFMGDTTDLDQVAHQVLLQAVGFWAEQERAFHAQVSHVAHLGRDPEEIAVALEVDSPEIREAQKRLTTILDMHGLPWANRFLYRPHMTQTYLPPDQAPEQGPLSPVLPISFREVLVSWGTDDTRFPLPDAVQPLPSVQASAGTDPWPALNQELDAVLESWETMDEVLTGQVATAVEMGWRAALERVGRSITKATNGDRDIRPVMVAASGEAPPEVNTAQLIAGPVGDTVEQVGRVLANAWDPALTEIFDRFAVVLEPEETTELMAAVGRAQTFLQREMTDLLMDRLEGPAALLLAEEPIPVEDPGAVPAQLVSDVLAIASMSLQAEPEGRPTRDMAGRPQGIYVQTGGDGLYQGPGGMWILELMVDAWADGEDSTPSILAAGRRGAGATMSDRLKADLAEAAQADRNRDRRVDYRQNVSTRRVQVIQNTWTLEMNGKVITRHEPVHEAMGGLVIITEGELTEVPAAQADINDWPYSGVRRPGDHRYCKCGWKTRVRFVEAAA